MKSNVFSILPATYDFDSYIADCEDILTATLTAGNLADENGDEELGSRMNKIGENTEELIHMLEGIQSLINKTKDEVEDFNNLYDDKVAKEYGLK